MSSTPFPYAPHHPPPGRAARHLERFDDLPTAVVGVDVAGLTLFWNRAAENLFGWPREDVLGRVPPIVPDELQLEWRLQMRQVIDGDRSPDAAETQRCVRDGRLVSVLRSSAPLHDARGEVIGVLDTLTDITALKQMGDESRALSQVRERELIAMDLHDGMIQSLFAVALNLAAQERTDNLTLDDARQALQRARLEIEHTIGETRSYLFDLRARAFAPRDLLAGLRLLVDAVRLNGAIEPRIELDARVNERLDPEVRGHLLYVAREAIANILRHAQATSVSLQVVVEDDSVTLRVADDGRGFDTTTRTRRGHRGLRNMASRAKLVGGQLAVVSQPSGGTRITLEIPTRRRADAA
jgi:PAS domain S-box-containing protein